MFMRKKATEQLKRRPVNLTLIQDQHQRVPTMLFSYKKSNTQLFHISKGILTSLAPSLFDIYYPP